jgi:hypothetical protein
MTADLSRSGGRDDHRLAEVAKTAAANADDLQPCSVLRTLCVAGMPTSTAAWHRMYHGSVLRRCHDVDRHFTAWAASVALTSFDAAEAIESLRAAHDAARFVSEKRSWMITPDGKHVRSRGWVAAGDAFSSRLEARIVDLIGKL